MMTGSAQFRYHPDDATLSRFMAAMIILTFPIMKALNVDCLI